MHIKRYKGHRLPDVMRQVREDLGEEAVILHTKAGSSRGLRRLIGAATVEVVAAVDELAPSPGPAPNVTGVRVERARIGVAIPPQLAMSADVAAELLELRHLIMRTSGARALPSALAPLYDRLIGRGLDAVLSVRLLEGLVAQDASVTDDTGIDTVEARLAALIDVGDSVLPPRAATLAVVGPSGAGKTTVVAKLAVAAHVAALTPELLTLDGSTVGATTQLETLGRIIDAPCTVALTRREVAAALDGPPSGPRLIDTPAVSVRDPDAVAALAELLRAAAPADVHLVLPATATRDDLLAMVRAFAPLRATHVLFTRLDEAAAPGTIVAAAHAAGRPLSFIGTGRDVTQDLDPAVARDVARRILHGDMP